MNARSFSQITSLAALSVVMLAAGVRADSLLAAPDRPADPAGSTTAAARVALSGSERDPFPGAHAVAAADPNERLVVSVRLRRPASLEAYLRSMRDLRPRERRYLSRQELSLAFGADPEEPRRVEAFASESGLNVVTSDPGRRLVELEGPVAAFEAAFGVALKRYEYPGGSFRGHEGGLTMPAGLAGIVESVTGLDDRPQAEPRLRERAPQPRANGDASFTPVQVGQSYNFPAGVDGTGQCIGIIELGGGFRDVDLDNYFALLNLPRPQVTAISVDGAPNRPTKASSADGEVMLDIEIAGAAAPGATIAVYFAPNSSRGFLDAIDAAIHDTQNKPSVISISWGQPEKGWTGSTISSMDQLFQEAASLGVTVCVASGDSGATDGIRDGKHHVDFPASSPYTLSCGGTRFLLSGSAVTGEVVWDDGPSGGASGGGASNVFAQPEWQSRASVPAPGGRGVPDVAGNASPHTGYQVLVDGQKLIIGGTSAVAPLWAGLVARLNQSLGQNVGHLNPLLAALSSGPIHDITVGGGQSAFPAATGWDAATGFGSPDGTQLLQALSGKSQ